MPDEAVHGIVPAGDAPTEHAPERQEREADKSRLVSPLHIGSAHRALTVGNAARLLTFAWAGSLVAALWLAALTPRASGYDLSILLVYPRAFWVLSIVSSVCAAAIPFLLAASRTRSPWWTSGLLGVIGSKLLVLSLPLFRGYAVYDRTDDMNHIGYMRDILHTHTLGQQDFYPAAHVLLYAVYKVAGIGPGAALITLSMVFNIVWILGIVLLAQRLANSVFAGYVAVSLTALFAQLSQQADPIPNVISATLVPILFLLLLRMSSSRASDRAVTALPALALAAVLAVFHPVTSLYAIGETLAFGAVAVLYPRLNAWGHPNNASLGMHFGQKAHRGDVSTASTAGRGVLAGDKLHFGQFIRVANFLAVCLLAWSLSFSIIDANIATVIRSLLGQGDQNSAAAVNVGQLAQADAHLPLSTLASIVWNSYGLPVLIIAMTVSLTLVLVIRSVVVRRLPPRIHVSFIAAYLATMLLAVGTLSVNSPEREPVRLVRMLVILGLCALSWWLWEALFSRQVSWSHWPSLGRRARRAGLAALAILLAYLIALGQLDVYASPLNAQPNEQVTSSELVGMRWLIRHRLTTPYLQASDLPNYVFSYEAYYLGYDDVRAIGRYWYLRGVWLPSHFYDPSWHHCMAKMAPGATTYLALSRDAIVLPLRLPKIARTAAHEYSARYWRALSSDPSLSEIYDNGIFQVWLTDGNTAACRSHAH